MALGQDATPLIEACLPFRLDAAIWVQRNLNIGKIASWFGKAAAVFWLSGVCECFRETQSSLCAPVHFSVC